MHNNFDNDTTYALSPVTQRLVHIDEVERGLACNCICPCCKQPMIANKGEKNQHYFSHERKGGYAFDKEACRNETMHRLAIQIIRDNKSVKLPPYENIEKARKVNFVSVEVEERNDRSDMQPDIVGITNNGRRYLIEIKYSHGVDLKKIEKIYSDDLTCVEIDISQQRMDDLKDFLLNSPNKRKWINNKYAFDSIVDYYKKHGKDVRVIPRQSCKIKYDYSLCERCLNRISYKGDSYIICDGIQDCSYSYIPDPIAPHREYNDITSKESELKKITPLVPIAPQSSVRRQWIETSRVEPKGANDIRNYKCIPEDFSIDDYYNNIHINDVFYEEEGVCYKVINHFRSNNIFGVVLAGIHVNEKYKYSMRNIVIMKKESLLHLWSRIYFDEHFATLDLKKRLASMSEGKVL